VHIGINGKRTKNVIKNLIITTIIAIIMMMMMMMIVINHDNGILIKER